MSKRKEKRTEENYREFLLTLICDERLVQAVIDDKIDVQTALSIMTHDSDIFLVDDEDTDIADSYLNNQSVFL